MSRGFEELTLKADMMRKTLACQRPDDFIQMYNQCFYDRDLDGLRSLYSSDEFSVFWDNHKDCDSTNLDDHFAKLATFFETGKETEAGEVEPLQIEDMNVCNGSDMAVVTAILRYQSTPRPGVRSTFVLINHDNSWRAVHIHHSFDPNEH
ncbi:MAG: nuclear transport factor 2 family protein [Pseudomonadota bacterium]